MKNIIRASVYLLISILLFSSCEKVIDIDLGNTEPKIVIEATIANDSLPCKVSITKTINFDQSNNFPGVAGATISLSDNAGNTENLLMTSTGLYQSASMIGVQGRTYTLKVEVEGKTFSAVSTIPNQRNLDSLTVDSISFIGATQKNVTPHYTDSLGIKNYYRFKLFVNNEMDKTIFIDDDEFSDGRAASRPLFGDLEIESGDSVRLEMQCIDKAVYLYFFSLSQSQDGPNSTGAPANPVSNFSGGCLGYFNAHTLQRASVKVQ